MKLGWFEFRDRLVCRTRSRQGNFKRVACYAMLGAAAALFPLRSSAASDNTHTANLLAVVNDNANDVAATTFVMP
jgi:hypothetical protein